MVEAYIVFLIILIIILFECAVRAKKHESVLDRRMGNLMFVGVVAIAANIMYVSGINRFIAVTGFSLFSLMMDWMLFALCMFVEEYAHYTNQMPRIRWWFFVSSVIDSILFLVNIRTGIEFSMERHMLFGKYFIFEVKNFTYLYYVHLVICYLMVLITVCMLLYGIYNASLYYRKKYTGVLVIFVLLIMSDGICVLLHLPLNISIVFYGAMSIAIYYFALFYIPGELVNKVQTLMMDRLDTGIIFFDENGKCIYSNASMWNQLGREKNTEKAEQKFNVYIERSKLLDGEYSKWDEEHVVNGETRFFEVACLRLYDKADNYVGSYFSMLDRTEQVNFYNRKIEMEKESNRAKSAFLSKVSHEIRTPVNSIYGMNEMIIRECNDSAILQYADQIKSATDTLIGLINDILDFSKIEAGKMDIVDREYNIKKILKNVCNMTKVRTKEKNLEFCLEVGDGIPSVLIGDDVRIEQVLMNLLSNAVKYTNEGSVTLKLGWTGNSEKGTVDIYVTDTGIGIKNDDIPKLFKEFERIEETRNHSIQGTGLGLNITTNLLSRMKSRLEVESEYGAGTTFYCHIPQLVVNDTPLKFGLGDTEDVEKSDYRPVFTSPDSSILIVDDNRLNRVVFRNLLKATRVKVYEAGSGAECLDMIKKQHFDIVFMDYMMPEMDGVMTFRKMKETEHMCKESPVIMLTANAVQGAMEEYLEQGFADFLSKPIIPEKLEKMIIKYLKKTD